MNGMDLLRSAFNAVVERREDVLGAKAAAEPASRAVITSFIMVGFRC
jgi:hypothetical protein